MKKYILKHKGAAIFIFVFLLVSGCVIFLSKAFTKDAIKFIEQQATNTQQQQYENQIQKLYCEIDSLNEILADYQIEGARIDGERLENARYNPNLSNKQHYSDLSKRYAHKVAN